jgi:hypothetical protein
MTDFTAMSTDPGARSVTVVMPWPETKDRVRTTGSSKPEIVTAAELADEGNPEMTNFRLPVENTLIKSSPPPFGESGLTLLLGG